MKLYFAPMEGITSYIFRNAHYRYFGGIDKYFTPFLAPNQAHCFMPREKRDVLPEHNEGIPVVPQILTNNPEHFIKTAKALKDMGYGEVNLNVGCPSGTVTAKKRGAGFLSEPDQFDEFLDRIFTELDVEISVKTRIGIEDPEEFEQLLEIYNDYPMKELIVHPRLQKDYYKGKPRMASFDLAVEKSINVLCYNGNLFSAKDYENWHQNYPQIPAVMIGRGAVSDPSLPLQIRGKKRMSKERFLLFHQAVCEGYLTWNCGDRNVLFKMKELWFYFGMMFPEGKKYLKKIKKSQNLKDYMSAVESLVKQCDMTGQGNF